MNFSIFKTLRTVPKQDGFSLIEVMVSVAILSVVIAGWLGALNASQAGQNQVKARDNVRNIGFEARQITETVANCGIKELSNEQTIDVSDASWDAKTEYVINLADGFVELGDGKAYNQLAVEKLRLGARFGSNAFAYTPIPVTAPLSTATQIRASIALNTKAFGDGALPSYRPTYISVTLVLSVDRKKIIACFPTGDSDQLKIFCDSVGGTWDDVTAKCQLPCPNGLTNINGNCVSPDDDGSLLCEMIDNCNVHSKYVN